ncbi:hypothetical protein MKX01_024412 [Papaver californicum]|nr:hypothetical protein MKX01_024412 [Papaver californicum]
MFIDLPFPSSILICIVSVQWKHLPTSNEHPLARAYHTMTAIGSRYLLFGGLMENLHLVSCGGWFLKMIQLQEG